MRDVVGEATTRGRSDTPTRIWAERLPLID
jgi:hypothetical protein